MRTKYHVVPVYEGHCPTCKQYQNSHVSSKHVDDECSECKRKKVIKAFAKEGIKVDGNEIAGFRISVHIGNKTYCIDARDFKEAI